MLRFGRRGSGTGATKISQDHDKAVYSTSANGDDEIIEVMPLVNLGISCFDAEPIHIEGERKQNNELTFLLSEKLFQGKIPLKVQEQIITKFKSIINKINGVTGSISYDTRVVTPQGSTYFESYYNIHPYHYTSFYDKIRGYFWANWLSHSHVEQLGGIDSILNQSPCYKVDILEINEQKGVYLQLTPDINLYENNSIYSLRTYLLPLLFFGNQNKKVNDNYYSGEVPRLVEK